MFLVGRGWYIQDGARSVSGSYFVPMNFVKSNKKNNSKISLWYKLTYAGMCIKFRSKTDLERRFPRRDCFCWRGWYSRQRSLCLRKYSTESAPFIRILQGTFTQLTNCGYPTWPYLAQLSAQLRYLGHVIGYGLLCEKECRFSRISVLLVE